MKRQDRGRAKIEVADSDCSPGWPSSKDVDTARTVGEQLRATVRQSIDAQETKSRDFSWEPSTARDHHFGSCGANGSTTASHLRRKEMQAEAVHGRWQ
ncbi:hypothetical protein ANO11243_009010 [Dothideomycetidae sp. 11243]|nr:hypothetical protein ANO11243_009010 [fungal sp. No.11243]